MGRGEEGFRTSLKGYTTIAFPTFSSGGKTSPDALTKHLKNTKLNAIEFLRTEVTSDPQTEIENTSRKER